MCSVCWTHDSVLWGLGYFRATTEYRYNCMSIFKVEFPAVNEVSTLSSAHFFVNCQVITKIRWNELLSHRKLPSPYPGIKFPWKQVFHLIRAGWVSYRVPKGLCGTCVREVVEKCPCAEVLHCDCANIKGPLKMWNQLLLTQVRAAEVHRDFNNHIFKVSNFHSTLKAKYKVFSELQKALKARSGWIFKDRSGPTRGSNLTNRWLKKYENSNEIVKNEFRLLSGDAKPA